MADQLLQIQKIGKDIKDGINNVIHRGPLLFPVSTPTEAGHYVALFDDRRDVGKEKEFGLFHPPPSVKVHEATVGEGCVVRM